MWTQRACAAHRYDQRDRILMNFRGMARIVGIRVLIFHRISNTSEPTYE